MPEKYQTAIEWLLFNDAVFDDQGNVITDPTQKQGWHVNFIGELPSLAQSYIVNLTSPDRIFA